MKNTPPSLVKLAALAAGAVALLWPSLHAATFPLTVTNVALGPDPVTLTLVQADGFNEGGAAGNTVRTDDPSLYFSTGSIPAAGSGLWHWRDFGGLNLSGGPDPGGLDLIETAPAISTPELRTTISGLPSDTYEVYLVYTTRPAGGETPQLLADLETGTVTTATTLRQRDASTISTGRTAASVWDISLQPLGQVIGTGFSLLVSTSPTSTRGDYIGVAYVPAGAARFYLQPVPQTTFGGGSVTFTAAAFGKPVPSYQWLKNGVDIPGATGETLALNNVAVTDAGLYAVRASSGAGSVISTAASLVVIAPQTATTSIVAIGTNAPFNFVAADPYLSGGSAGNTVQTPDPALDFAVQQAEVEGYWNYRDFGNLDFYGVNPEDPDLFETGDTRNAPTLRTTLAGLPSAIYEVCLVQISANSGAQSGLLADLDPTGSGTTATTLRQRNSATFRTGVGIQNMLWEVDLQPLGQVSGSSITVLVGDAGNRVSRGDYLGVAYRPAPLSAPTIATQPAGQTAHAGSRVSFTVSALGNPPPTYQWRKNGTDIGGATGSSYTIASLTTADAGEYSVRVSNNLGNVDSSSAALNVFAPTSPEAMDITLGTNATFHFVLPDVFTSGGAAGNTVQIADPAAYFADTVYPPGPFWYYRDFAGLDLFGVGEPAGLDLIETSGVADNLGPALRTSITGLPAGDREVYLVHLTDNRGGLPAGLLADLEAEGLTTPVTLRTRGAFTFRTGLLAAGVWEVDLTLVGQTSGSDFNLLVGDAGPAVARGDYVGLAYRPVPAGAPVRITGHPASSLAYAGSSRTLAASAIGAPPLTYEWRRNGVSLAGATGPTLVLENIQSSDAGLYDCVVSNAGSSATSSTATLNVFAPLEGGLMDISIGDSPTLRFVPANAFTEGTAGNTVALNDPAAPFAVVNEGASPGYWNYRDFANLDLYSAGTSDNLDLLETGQDNQPLPTLKTTLSGLTPATYEVFLVHNWRPDLGEQPGLRADLEAGGITDAITVRRETVNAAGTLRTRKTASIFEVVLQPLGQATGPGFSVLVKPIDAFVRGDYIGLAYRLAAPPTLSIARDGTVTRITWAGTGTLQVASEVTGTFEDVPSATSPYTVDTTAAVRRFYRLKR